MAVERSNSDIIDFLKRRGYHDDILAKVKDARVCSESIHLLKAEDFKEIGIALADARLLAERFRKSSADALASCVASARKESHHKKVTKKEKVAVEYAWHHWSAKEKKYKQLKLSSGGGSRKKCISRDATLEFLFDDIKEIYFPNGRSSKGLSSEMIYSLYAADMTPIENLELTVGQVIDSKALKIARFHLRSKKKSIVFDEEDDGDDFFDYHPARTQHKASTPRRSGSQEDLLEQQLAPTNTANDRSYGSWLQSYRKSLVAEEPSLSSDCSLITVYHMNVGRSQRFFPSNSTMELVYNWVGSLDSDPKFFELYLDDRNVEPSEPTCHFENKFLEMREVLDSNFTMNVLFNPPPRSSNFSLSTASHCQTSSENKKQVSCPVCFEVKSIEDIEQHAAACAQNNFPNILEEYDEEAMDDEEEQAQLGQETQQEFLEIENFQVVMKNIIKNCTVDNENAIKLKIRRKHVFQDFCSRVSKKWVQEKLGAKFYITFYGESGVDQGGLSREFFSDALHDISMQLLENDGSGNLIPRISLIEAVACGKFKMAGQLIASSIVLNGPAPTFFAPWIYRYFIGGIQHLLKDIPNAIPETTGLSRSYNKIQHIEDTNKLQKFMMTDEGLDILTEIGYIGVPSKVTLESKQQILRSIFTKEIIQKTLPALEQLTEGMELYGLLRLMRQNEHVFRFVFCQNDKMKWTFDKIDSLLLPMYNTEGSNAKAREIDTYKAFVEALEEFSETGEPLTIDEFMKFLTGSSTLPPIGLPNDIKVEFVHSCVPNCKCKPSISACCISISLAVHYKEVEEMKNALKDAVQLSYGFDDL